MNNLIIDLMDSYLSTVDLIVFLVRYFLNHKLRIQLFPADLPVAYFDAFMLLLNVLGDGLHVLHDLG